MGIGRSPSADQVASSQSAGAAVAAREAPLGPSRSRARRGRSSPSQAREALAGRASASRSSWRSLGPRARSGRQAWRRTRARAAREPGAAVGEVAQRPRQLHEITHHGALAQRHEVDAEGLQTRASAVPRSIGSGVRVRRRPARHVLACGSRARRAAMRAASARASATRSPKSRSVTGSGHPALRRGGARRHARGIGDRARARSRRRGKILREQRVGEVDAAPARCGSCASGAAA